MTAVLDVVWVLGCLLGVCGFGGMALLLAIQCHHTAAAEARVRKTERRAEWHARENDRLCRSNDRLRQLLDRQAGEHAERLADLVAVVGTDTAEPAEMRTS